MSKSKRITADDLPKFDSARYLDSDEAVAAYRTQIQGSASQGKKLILLELDLDVLDFYEKKAEALGWKLDDVINHVLAVCAIFNTSSRPKPKAEHHATDAPKPKIKGKKR